VHNTGVCYDYGQGVAKDERKAVEYYQLAAAQNHATAQHNLGALHFCACVIAPY
jgi:TPR repeat protein